MINDESYESFVHSLIKNPVEVMFQFTPETVNMLHMAVGISGEAGELLDAIKKVAIYGKEFDYDNVIEELGDLEFYLAGLRAEFGLSRKTILDANITKLRTRYGDQYSDEAAIERKDK